MLGGTLLSRRPSFIWKTRGPLQTDSSAAAVLLNDSL
jgi:hypothetical protein